MPTYDYACAACGNRFEVVHGVFADGPTECPSCGGGPVRKAFVAPTVLFKGSGWAKMDRRATPAAKSSGTGTDDAAAKPPKEGGGEPATPAATGSSDGASSGSTPSGSSTDTTVKSSSSPTPTKD